MRVVATIQARMSSSRLPGKVMMPIAGRPMLAWQIDRLKRSRLVDEIIIATTENKADNAIVELCEFEGINCFRGSESDVLGRVAGAVGVSGAQIHVECFGDSPLIDPRIVDEFVGYLLKHWDRYDFVSNSITTTYPPGSEVLVYKSEALLQANELVDKGDPLREHVSLHIYGNEEKFRICNLTAPDDLAYPDFYLEVDTKEDFSVMQHIIEMAVENKKINFPIEYAISLLEESPEIAKQNSSVHRRWREFRNDI